MSWLIFSIAMLHCVKLNSLQTHNSVPEVDLPSAPVKLRISPRRGQSMEDVVATRQRRHVSWRHTEKATWHMQSTAAGNVLTCMLEKRNNRWKNATAQHSREPAPQGRTPPGTLLCRHRCTSFWTGKLDCLKGGEKEADLCSNKETISQQRRRPETSSSSHLRLLSPSRGTLRAT